MLAMASSEDESESKHSLDIIDSVPALIHTGRPDGYLDYFNQRWLDYVGVPMQGLLGWKFTAVIHLEDVEAIVNRWRSSIASMERVLHEVRVRRADGAYRWMRHYKSPCVTSMERLSSGTDRVSKSRTASAPKNGPGKMPKNCKEASFYLEEGQRLGRIGCWVFDPARGFDYWSRELFHIQLS